ncbi:MAG: sucrase ferredoxin [Micromonosporaceae bacterium]|nr:sucrase ferredoxin [Micromonosporaceae bacterium]
MTEGDAADRAAPYRCAAAALRRGDPLVGTAALVPRWLLIEEPGGWGVDGLTTSPVAADVARTLSERARRAGVRVQLIRRPGKRRNRPAVRAAAFVDAEAGLAWWHGVRTDRDLLDIPLDQPHLAAEASREPIYLVCAHGRKDVCCAMRGRPIAEHLASHRADATWETTHLGGHRFAANLVALPHGLYYGQLTFDTALAAVKAYESGHVLPRQLRGRSTQPPPAQAAECLARQELGETRLDAIRPVSATQLDEHEWRVALAWADTTALATVRAVLSPLPAQLSCGDPHAKHYRTFELVSLVTGAAREVGPQGAEP